MSLAQRDIVRDVLTEQGPAFLPELQGGAFRLPTNLGEETDGDDDKIVGGDDFLTLVNVPLELQPLVLDGRLVIVGYDTAPDLADPKGSFITIAKLEPAGSQGGPAGPSAIDFANLDLRTQELAQQAEFGRAGATGDLLNTILGIQRDPFSVVPALSLFGAAGGGTQAPANALALTQGRGIAPELGGIVGDLVRELTQFTGATPINPNTGTPFTPGEMQFLRLVDQQRQTQPPVPGGIPSTQPTGIVDQVLPTTTAAAKPLRQPAQVRPLTQARRASVNQTVRGALTNGTTR